MVILYNQKVISIFICIRDMFNKGDKINYKKLKEEYLNRLEDVEKTLIDISKYEKFNIFTEEEIKNLKQIKNKNNLYLSKLKNGEIEIAIVGMENTGKSTFANALIKLKEAFPTGSTRCTFTSTKLQYGKEDKAVVAFFSKDDFNKMFQEMLQDVKYPNYESVKFETLDYQQYNGYFEKLKDIDIATYKYYGSTVHEDIKSILNGKSEILNYLDKTNIYFDKSQIQKEELRKFITNEYIARTVKQVNLELSEFEDTKEMVLYDVPGFNSITEKHKIETRKSLNSADAIILIKNVMENSQITSEEQSMLNSYDEETGVALSEKLFVFGTKIDRANTKDEAINNTNKLKSDLKKNLNVNLDRLFVGSPFAYMQSLGLEDGNGAIITLKSWDMENSINSIENMKISIKEFYRNEAFRNIQKQINKNIEAVKTILANVISDNKDHRKILALQSQNNGLLLDYVRRFREKTSEELEVLNNDFKKDINENQYFSNKLKEQLETIIPLASMKELEKINLSKTDIRGEFATIEVNIAYRESLKNKLLKNFVDLTVSIANEKSEEFFNKTIESMMDILEVFENNIYKEEIQKELELFIKNLTKDASYSKTSYVYLIQRFSRDLISVVIGTGKGTSTRKNRFLEAKKEFVSLAIYNSDKFQDIENIYHLPLIKKVLNLEKKSEDNSFEERIKNNFSKLASFGEFLTIIKFMSIKNIPIDIAITIIEKSNKKFKSITQNNISIVIKKISASLDQYMDKKQKNEFQDELHQLFESVKQSQNKKELLEEINSDILLLKEILKTAVIGAINLELPFITSFVDQNKKIISSKKELDSFIQKNFSKIKYEELNQSEELKVQLEEKKRVIENIKKLLSNIG
jgi:hypothetical protein